jgi:hypothetical protein
MVIPTCSRCGKAILSEDVNVANDVAYCRGCNLSHKLSALTEGTELDAAIDLNQPPAGAWYTNDGMGSVIGATHRSLGTAIGALAFGVFDKQWSDSDGRRQRKSYIVIETREGKLVKFGSMLAEERRKFVAGAVRKVLWG